MEFFSLPKKRHRMRLFIIVIGAKLLMTFDIQAITAAGADDTHYNNNNKCVINK